MSMRCHVAGVAGIGMSALAQVLLARGWQVSGSDRFLDSGENLDVLRKLRVAGVEFVPQNGVGVTGADCTVVVSSAIEADNPDVVAAGRVGASVVHRAEMLARLIGRDRCVAVTGTSGKTTVTGMTGWILQGLGADPTVVNGGIVPEWADERRTGSVRVGKAPLWVVEADESDRSLLHFTPDWAVITNIGKDHFGTAETGELFAQFCRRVKSGVIGEFGAAPAAVSILEQTFFGARFQYDDVMFRIRLPGRHNVDNARHAIAVCSRLGFDLRAIGEALETFGGIERRLQVVGRREGVTIIDDYAHNPAKIRAAWECLTPHFGRILAVWRPHGFGPLAFMQQELVEVLAAVCRPSDALYVLPVFYAGGTAKRTVTSETFVENLRAHGVPAVFIEDYDRCVGRFASIAKAGDAVMVMGARDPQLPLLARAIAKAL